MAIYLFSKGEGRGRGSKSEGLANRKDRGIGSQHGHGHDAFPPCRRRFPVSRGVVQPGFRACFSCYRMPSTPCRMSIVVRGNHASAPSSVW